MQISVHHATATSFGVKKVCELLRSHNIWL